MDTTEKRIFKIGTRGSGLALVQANWVKDTLTKAWPAHEFELVIIKTTGDKLQTAANAPTKLDKGIFIKEIEEALVDGSIDLAVHSCKDLPVEQPEGLKVIAYPPREDARDVLLLKEGLKLDALPDGGTFRTGSSRRILQLKEKFAQCEVAPIRGNIDTRLRKVREDKGSVGLMLAHAGLNRLGPDTSGFQIIPMESDVMVPAPGQGSLALEAREDDALAAEVLAVLNDTKTAFCVVAERAFLNAMGGGCQAPLGGWVTDAEKSGSLTFHSVFFESEDAVGVKHSLIVDDHQGWSLTRAEELGQEMAKKF